MKINNAIAEEEGTALADAARAEFHKMELGDEENIALWKWFIEISLAEYEKTYKQLGITFDSYKGESFYTDKMPAQVEKLREMGVNLKSLAVIRSMDDEGNIEFEENEQ